MGELDRATRPYFGMSHPRKGVVEVEQYRFGNLKMVFGLVFVGIWLTIFWLAYDYTNSGTRLNSRGQEITRFHDLTWDLGYIGYGYLWGEHPSWKHTYEVGCVQENAYGCTSQTTPWEFTQMNIRDGARSLVIDAIALIPFLIFMFTYPFIRKPAPVCFNQDLGAIYGWHRGQLWILPKRDFEYEFKTEPDLASWIFDSGPMRIKLYSAKNPKKSRTFLLGTYPNHTPYYGMELGQNLQRYMQSVTEIDMAEVPRSFTYHWWQRSLLGKRELPADIDQRAAEWIKQQGIEIPPPYDKAAREAEQAGKAAEQKKREEEAKRAEGARQSALFTARRLFRSDQ